VSVRPRERNGGYRSIIRASQVLVALGHHPLSVG
jgi:hypothetical protein